MTGDSEPLSLTERLALNAGALVILTAVVNVSFRAAVALASGPDTDVIAIATLAPAVLGGAAASVWIAMHGGV